MNPPEFDNPQVQAAYALCEATMPALAAELKKLRTVPEGQAFWGTFFATFHGVMKQSLPPVETFRILHTITSMAQVDALTVMQHAQRQADEAQATGMVH